MGILRCARGGSAGPEFYLSGQPSAAFTPAPLRRLGRRRRWGLLGAAEAVLSGEVASSGRRLRKVGRAAKALARIDKLEAIRPLSLRFQALKGELLLRTEPIQGHKT